MKVFPATRANDVSQYGGIANRRVALTEAMGDVNNNLNAGCSGVLSSSVADGGQVECFVVVSACREHQAIAQSRCLRLTGTDIHIYIHTYIQTGDDNSSQLLASAINTAGLIGICTVLGGD